MRRLDCDTADWHVFARGARRLELIRDDEDCAQFLIFLKYALKKSGCILWAFALMTNHYHLVLRGGSAQLTACMRRLNNLYSRYHNQRYKLSGHAFDGPYHAYRKATPGLTLWTIAYVLFNPVKAGLCGRPEDYPWSSCRSFLGLPGSPLEVRPAPLIKEVNPDVKVGWKKFHQAMESEARRQERRPVGKLTMAEVHMDQFEWLLDYAKQHAEELCGEEPRTVAVYWARQCGISPRAIAKALDLPLSVLRNDYRRFSRRVASEPHLKALLTLP
jgi:putative transposase